MKKVILSFLFMICLCNIVQAETKMPEWSDFCPQEYLYSQPVKLSFWDGANTRLMKNEYNYWSNRKGQFNIKLLTCNNLADIEKEKCYIKVREEEIAASMIHIQDTNIKIQKNIDSQQAVERASQYLQQQQLINALTAPQTVNVHHY